VLADSYWWCQIRQAEPRSTESADVGGRRPSARPLQLPDVLVLWRF